ncbi:MAG: hypothetical protein ACE5GS_15910 [Kiloniellaceae bacterium]
MACDDDFLNSIPKFLRRPQEPWPERPMFMTGPRPESTPPAPAGPETGRGPAPAMPKPGRAPAAADTRPTARKPGALPWLARKRPAVEVGPASPPDAPAPSHGRGVVDLASHRADGPPGGALPREVGAAAEPEPDDGDDAAFQVTLPRGVIRQIRLRAAEEGTTHRAIVLRALRGAGLSVPEGADVDRRAVAAKRRQPA